MAIDYSKLKGRIVEKFGTRSNFCAAMGMSFEMLSRRLSGKTPFSTAEYIKACALLDIQPEEMSAYFFTPKLR